MSVIAQTHESLDDSYYAVPTSVGEARQEVAALARRGGAAPHEVERIRLAVSEAVSNAIEHGYAGDGRGIVQVTAAAIDRELTVVVADDGRGMRAAGESPGLGLGLGVISAACDSFTLMTRSSGGTQVEMTFRLTAGPSPCSLGAGAPRRVSCVGR